MLTQTLTEPTIPMYGMSAYGNVFHAFVYNLCILCIPKPKMMIMIDWVSLVISEQLVSNKPASQTCLLDKSLSCRSTVQYDQAGVLVGLV